MEKEIINKLFLELSQIADAESHRENIYKNSLRRVMDLLPLDHPARQEAANALKRAEISS